MNRFLNRLNNVDLGWAALGAALIITMVTCGVGAFVLGQYIGFDQLNYHVYSAWSYFHSAYEVDGAPGGIQGFHNPVSWLPWYGMMMSFPPVLTGIATGLLQSGAIWLGLVACWIVTRGQSNVWRLATLGSAFVIAMASPLLSENLGTSFNDLPTAGLVMAAAVILLAGCPGLEIPPRSAIFACALAGCLCGAAVGLKLTNAVFLIALTASASIGWTCWRHRLAAVAAILTGGLVGTALLLGPWSMKLWGLFHNPVFPYYNSLFRSQDFPLIDFRDVRYLPRTVWAAIGYPLRIATGQPETSEFGLRDWRYVTVFAACAMTMILAAARLLVQPARSRTSANPIVLCRLLAFMTVSWVVWLAQFAILRYMFPFELLFGALLAALGRIWGDGAKALLPPLVAAGIAAATFTPNYPARRPWQGTWFQASGFDRLPPGSDFITGSWPLAYLAPFLPDGARLFSPTRVDNGDGVPMDVHDETVFARRLSAVVAGSSRIFAIDRQPLSLRFRSILGGYGLTLRQDCVPLSTIAHRLLACELERSVSSPLAAATMMPDRSYNLEHAEDGGVFVVTLARGSWPGLAFRTQDGFSYHLTLTGKWPSPDVRVGIGEVALTVVLHEGALELCVDATMRDLGGTVLVRLGDASSATPSGSLPQLERMTMRRRDEGSCRQPGGG